MRRLLKKIIDSLLLFFMTLIFCVTWPFIITAAKLKLIFSSKIPKVPRDGDGYPHNPDHWTEKEKERNPDLLLALTIIENRSPSFLLESDKTRLEFGKNLVRHLEMIGQIPGKATDQEMEEYYWKLKREGISER